MNYTIRYVDSSTGKDLDPPVQKTSSQGVVTEKALHIPDYIVDKVTKSCMLAASQQSDADTARDEELAMNVITFYYTQNIGKTVYEVNHYAQNSDGSSYSLYQNQTFTIDKNETVDVTSLYLDSLLTTGYKVDHTSHTGTVTPTETDYLVIDIYYNRKMYPYVVKLVDIDTGNVLKQINGGNSLLGSTVSYTADSTFTDDVTGITYDRLSDEHMSINIRLEEDAYGNTLDINDISKNVITIYYKNHSDFVVKYSAVTLPNSYIDILDNILLSNRQEIVSNSTEITGSSVLSYPSDRCKFLGWFDNPEGTGTPKTTNQTIDKDIIGTIDTNTNYYAVFRTLGTLKLQKFLLGNGLTADDNNKEFDVEVTLTSDFDLRDYELTYSKQNISGASKISPTYTDSGKKATFILKISKNDAIITINGIPHGSWLTVDEVNIPPDWQNVSQNVSSRFNGDVSVPIRNKKLPKAFLTIEKYIDSLYYDSNDNPHNFSDDKSINGYSTDKDKYGYLNYTKAQQAFVFEIQETTAAGETHTYNVVLDFPADITANNSGKYQYVVSKTFRVTPGSTYTVKELDSESGTNGLSWRYNFDSVTGSSDGASAVVTNDSEKAEVKYSSLDDMSGDVSVNVSFYSSRNDSVRNIESDMSLIKNTISSIKLAKTAEYPTLPFLYKKSVLPAAAYQM